MFNAALRAEVAQACRKLLSSECGIDGAVLIGEDIKFDDLDIDSIDTAALLCGLEELYGCVFPNGVAEAKTLGEFIDATLKVVQEAKSD